MFFSKTSILLAKWDADIIKKEAHFFPERGRNRPSIAGLFRLHCLHKLLIPGGSKVQTYLHLHVAYLSLYSVQATHLSHLISSSILKSFPNDMNEQCPADFREILSQRRWTCRAKTCHSEDCFTTKMIDLLQSGKQRSLILSDSIRL